MPGQREWKKQLGSVWRYWDAAVEDARLSGGPYPALKLPELREDDSLIAYPPAWVCFRRGLGDFSRFALARCLHVRGHAVGASACDLSKASALKQDDWIDSIKACSPHYSRRVKKRLSDFDTQLRNKIKKDKAGIGPYELAAQLLSFIDDDGLWDALAATANFRMTLRSQAATVPLTGFELRNRRFAGPTAVADFVQYLNSGKVPIWQPPYPDKLMHLRVQAPGMKGFVHNVPYFGNRRRRLLLQDLARRLAEPPLHRAFRVSCLWSATEPHGLIAACRKVIRNYTALCAKNGWRRLQIIYIPVGLDTKAPHVSRKAVVRDLYRKVCVGRPNPRTRQTERRPLPQDVTGERLDSAIGEIRAALSARPALLIFGVYQVTPDPIERAIIEQTLDGPLPYILDRLMPETGMLERLALPADAFATQALVLSDGPVGQFSTFEVNSFPLPACSPRAFRRLLGWTEYERLGALHDAGELPNMESNEIELSIIESTLWLEDPADSPLGSNSLTRKMFAMLSGPTQGTDGPGRIEQITRLVIEHLSERACSSRAHAWFLTILQVVSLCAGGLRRETLARILAGYVLATTSSDEALRPDWQRAAEAPLWLVGLGDERLSEHDSAELCQEVVRQIGRFGALAGEHVRTLRNPRAAALGEAVHPFESPEVPAFSFGFRGRGAQSVMEVRYPVVQRTLRAQFAERCPQKHALLQRLIADEFIRRAAMIQRHRTDRDQLSLVEKRYAICAIYHGLDSLAFDRDRLMSREGRLRTRWLLEPSSAPSAYDWIYRWLYVDQLNGGHHTLSRQHGAELLKISLLKRFLAAGEAHQTVRRASLKPFLVHSQILQGLVHAGLRSCNEALAADGMRQLDELMKLGLDAVEDPKFLGDEKRQRTWLLELIDVERATGKLRLDGAVMYGLRFASSARHPLYGRFRRSVRIIVEALRTPGVEGFEALSLLREVRNAIRENRTRAPPFVGLQDAARRIRRGLPRKAVQCLYDYLLRYAQLTATLADSCDDLLKRTVRQKRALVIFELAEALRRGCAGDESEHVLRLSARPIRNALRLCLAIGKAMETMDRSAVPVEARTEAFWCWERAAYYAFHLIGHHSRYQVERVAALIIQASTIRMRSALSGKLKLEVAMRVLKTAEKALIHYPDRRQLWMRYYLERARLFRDRALQLGTQHVDTPRCTEYCRADVASVVRLSDKREYWVKRARRVVNGLPSGKDAIEDW